MLTDKSLQTILSATFIRNTVIFDHQFGRDLIFGCSIRGPGSSEPLTSADDPSTKFSSRSARNPLFLFPYVTEIEISVLYFKSRNKHVAIAIQYITFIFLSIRKICINYTLFANDSFFPFQYFWHISQISDSVSAVYS